MNKKRIVLFTHNVIAHPVMEWCHVLSINGRIGWLARFGEWLHDVTTPTDDTTPIATMTVNEFMDAARAIMERHGYGHQSCATSVTRWYHKHYEEGKRLSTHYGISFWAKGNDCHRTKDRPTPQLALQEMDLMLDLIALGQSTDTADMIIHEEPATETNEGEGDAQ